MSLHFPSDQIAGGTGNSKQPFLPARQTAGPVGRWWAELKNLAKKGDPLGEAGAETDLTAPRPTRCLIVGLGNPGAKYRRNRHNAGFMVVERLAELHEISMNRDKKKALVGQGHIDGRPVILAKPKTFMNLSGESVGPLASYFDIDLQDLLVIYDELDLPLGTIRLREAGGAGGHNGMKSLISHLGQGFPRLRLGIGRPPGRMPPAAYLLQDFGPDELPILEQAIAEAEKAVTTFLAFGIEMAMSRHNGPVERRLA